jgi:MFS family permease
LINRQRSAVSVAFLAFGAAIGSWVPRLPALKDHLHLTDGQIGIALVAYAIGAMLGSAAARFVLARGARRSVRLGTVLLCVALVTPGLAGNFAALAASLLFIGASAGFIDMLENAQAAELERLAGRPMINRFHGFWSLGGILGSASAGGAALLGVAPLESFAVAGVLIAAGSAWFLRDLPDTQSGAVAAPPSGAGRMWLTGSVVAVGAVALCGILIEGGTADWSALYLRELSHVDQGVAAGGFAGFALAATLVRFRADALTARWNPARVTRLGALAAVAGLALAIIFPALPSAVTGFALVGAGTAVIIPLAFGAGANLSRSGTALTIVTSSGYAGSIVGPALIGTAADHFGLRIAMVIPLAAGLAVAALARYLVGGAEKTAATKGPPARRYT